MILYLLHRSRVARFLVQKSAAGPALWRLPAVVFLVVLWAWVCLTGWTRRSLKRMAA